MGTFFLMIGVLFTAFAIFYSKYKKLEEENERMRKLLKHYKEYRKSADILLKVRTKQLHAIENNYKLSLKDIEGILSKDNLPK